MATSIVQAAGSVDSGLEPTRVVLVPIRRHGESMEMFNNSSDLKKAYSVRLGNGVSYPLRMEMVYCVFDMPLSEAARILRVSVSLAKRIRAWVKVDQWPCSMIYGGSAQSGNAKFGLTRDQIVKGRDGVISGLEWERRNCQAYMCDGMELALSIMKEARDYAALYARMVIPGAGRRPSERAMEQKRIKLEQEGRVRQIMESMQPRQAGRKTGLTKINTKVTVETTKAAKAVKAAKLTKLTKLTKSTVETTVTVTTLESTSDGAEPGDCSSESASDCFWPISIHQEFNFTNYSNSNFDEEVDDELGLGPITLSTHLTLSASGN